MSRRSVLVQLAVQVKAFQGELDRRSHQGWIALGAQLLDRPTHAPHFGRLANVLQRRHVVAHLDPQPVLEVAGQLLEATR